MDLAIADSVKVLVSTNACDWLPYKHYPRSSLQTVPTTFYLHCSFILHWTYGVVTVNIWNSLSADTDFSWLSGFINQINRMDLIEFKSISF